MKLNLKNTFIGMTGLYLSVPGLAPRELDDAHKIFYLADTSSIYLDSLSSNPAIGFIAQGTAGSNSGYSVNKLGDVNGDDIDDYIIGAPAANSSEGKSYIIYGRGDYMPSKIDLSNSSSYSGFIIAGDYSTKGGSGLSSNGAGDVNKDGIDDIIIGAPYAYGTGAAYVIYGNSKNQREDSVIVLSTNLDASVGFAIYNPNQNSQLGASVSGVGDIDGDGIDDIAIGASTGGDQNDGTGTVIVIYGGKNKTNVDLTSNKEFFYTYFGTEGDYIGYSVSGADINNDGLSDIIIGAPYTNSNQGKVYILYGSTNRYDYYSPANLNDVGLIIVGKSGSQFGWSVSKAGDVNKDGKDDMVIGAPAYNSNTGESYIIFGGSKLTSPLYIQNGLGSSGITITGISGSYSGSSVSNTGDINADGKDDIIIGAPFGGASNSAESFVIYGSTDLPETISLSNVNSYGFSIVGATGETDNPKQGYSVSGAGDINKDGYDDIIIGSAVTGNSYVIYGAKSGFVTYIPTNYPTKIPTIFPTSPTASPTSLPTFDPTQIPAVQPTPGVIDTATNDVITETISTIFTVIGACASAACFCFYGRIASIVKNCTGHKHKFIQDGNHIDLKHDEIGIRLNEKRNDLIIEFNKGEISKELAGIEVNEDVARIKNTIIKKLKEGDTSALSDSDNNVLRDYLIENKLIEPKELCCLIRYYSELGYCRGAIYHKFSKPSSKNDDHSKSVVITLNKDKEADNQYPPIRSPMHQENDHYASNVHVFAIGEDSGFGSESQDV
ncbi:MAG: FG-GAP-like repeat-containing protein [Rickettsiaceae bacterium]|nr:FG-GAP-like repeat-containing protein [Rickettsiaceae bacterium]